MLTPAQQRAEIERLAQVRERELIEHKRQVRGLLVLAIVVLVLSFARAGWDRVFPQGWTQMWAGH